MCERKHHRNIYVIALSLLLTASSCDKTKPGENDDKLSLPAQSYSGNEIRTDGYWYIKNIYDGVTWYSYCTFFYRNGVIFGGYSVQENNIESQEEEYRNGQFYGFASNKKNNWGRFIVEGEIIKYERWYPGDMSAGIREKAQKLRTFVRGIY